MHLMVFSIIPVRCWCMRSMALGLRWTLYLRLREVVVCARCGIRFRENLQIFLFGESTAANVWRDRDYSTVQWLSVLLASLGSAWPVPGSSCGRTNISKP